MQVHMKKGEKMQVHMKKGEKMFGTCDKCGRTGRAENLIEYQGEMRCPDCLGLGFMFWYRTSTDKFYRMMDFDKEALCTVANSELEELPERFKVYIRERCMQKIKNPAYEHKG